jgi:hypothetical protein
VLDVEVEDAADDPSTHASTSRSSGAPVRGAGTHPMPLNLSPPLAAKVRHIASWSSERMFTQKVPAFWMRGQVVDVFCGLKSTSGGSSESDWKLCAVNPTGSLPSIAVMIVTPVQKWPITWRRWATSKVGAPLSSRSSVTGRGR